MKVILPKGHSDIFRIWGTPVFFLAGPVVGGDDWQYRMCRLLQERVFGDFFVAIPCRYSADHPLQIFRAEETGQPFDRQLTWERYYLDCASQPSQPGCIIFWLPCESQVSPRSDGLPYAMDTRGELGEWRGRLMYNSRLSVVVGAEENFPGLSQIQRNFDQALGRDFPICGSMEETADAAVKMIGA